MRELVLHMQSTLDGFVGAPDGDVSWAMPDLDDEYARWAVDKLWDASAHLMGSVTYGEMAAHWPNSNEPYAPPMNEIPKIVFSRKMKSAAWKETRIVAGDVGQEIARLKRENGKPLLAHGGAAFARSLIATGLVDRYLLVFHPVVLGKGRAVFAEIAAPLRLELLDAKIFRTGTVAKHFRPA